MENIIFEVCLHTDYETTIKLLLLYPKILNNYNNIWKLKCIKQFPNKPYFDLWTGSENYLMCTKKELMIITHDIQCESKSLPYLYEYDKILQDIYVTMSNSCLDNINLVRLSLPDKDAKFFIIREDGYDAEVINFLESLDKSIEWLEGCINKNFWLSCNIYIIDINQMIPAFLGKKKRKHDKHKRSNYIHYYKFINDKLVQLIPESYHL